MVSGGFFCSLAFQPCHGIDFAIKACCCKAGEITVVGWVDVFQEGVVKFLAVAGNDPMAVICVKENSHNWLDCGAVEKVP